MGAADCTGRRHTVHLCSSTLSLVSLRKCAGRSEGQECGRGRVECFVGIERGVEEKGVWAAIAKALWEMVLEMVL